jgi:hypothetical protein
MVQLNEIRRMQQLAGLIKENEVPKSLTVKLTENFIKSHKLYKVNSPITMRGNGLDYNLGNTRSTLTEDTLIYFAEYKPEIGEILGYYYVIPARQKGNTNWFLHLVDKDVLFPAEVERINDAVQNGELRKVPDFGCSFIRDGNGLNVGSIDHRDYFKIIAIN